MEIDKKILSEISRYNSINNYIVEQEGELPPPPDEEPLPDGEVGGPMPAEDDLGVEPPMEPETGQTIDIKNDPDVDKINTDGDVVDSVNELSKGDNLHQLINGNPKNVHKITLGDLWDKFQVMLLCGNTKYGYCSLLQYDGDKWSSTEKENS